MSDSTVFVVEPQWPSGLRRRSAAAHLLGLRVPVPPRAWMSVSCESCVLSGRVLGLADHSSRGVVPSVVCRKSAIAKSPKGRL